MNLSPTISKILNSKLILYIAIGVMTYFIFDLYQDNQDLKNSREVWEQSAKERDEQLLTEIEEVRAAYDLAETRLEAQSKKIDLMVTDFNQFYSNISANEKTIDSMHDLDSISDLFSRVYPDNSRAGQGSN